MSSSQNQFYAHLPAVFSDAFYDGTSFPGSADHHHLSAVRNKSLVVDSSTVVAAAADYNRIRITKHHHHQKPHHEPSYVRTRSAANLRERRRMQCINEAFEGLRSHIPTLPYEKRLSKVDTLRLAICYINFLTKLVGSTEGSNPVECDDDYPSEHPNQGKIVIYSAAKEEHENGLPPLRGHSLSWSSETTTTSPSTPTTSLTRRHRIRYVKTKQIWRPEVPAPHKQKQLYQ